VTWKINLAISPIYCFMSKRVGDGVCVCVCVSVHAHERLYDCKSRDHTGG